MECGRGLILKPNRVIIIGRQLIYFSIDRSIERHGLPYLELILLRLVQF